MLVARTLAELRDHRVAAGLSQTTMAAELALSQPQLWRIEADQVADVTVTRLSEMASVLGYELSMGLHPFGDPIRDKGHQALAKRFEALLATSWKVTSETPLPLPGEQRAWDKLLRLRGEVRQLVGVDLETRIRDIQALVRRTRLRERDGGVDAILIVLSDTATSRRLAGELRLALGADFGFPAREIVKALRAGKPLPGSGLILV